MNKKLGIIAAAVALTVAGVYDITRPTTDAHYTQAQEDVRRGVSATESVREPIRYDDIHGICLELNGFSLVNTECNVTVDDGRYHIRSGNHTWSYNRNNNTFWRDGRQCRGDVVLQDYNQISGGTIKDLDVACIDFRNGEGWGIQFPIGY